MFKFFKKKNIQKKSSVSVFDVTQSIPLEKGSFLEYVFTGSGRIDASQAMSFYQKSSAIGTAVDKISTPAKQITPILRTAEGETITDHEVIEKLKNPNGFETWSDFMEQLCKHYLLTGDAHLCALGNVARPPLEVYAVKPQLVSVIADSRDYYPSKYTIYNGVGRGEFKRYEKGQVNRFYSGNLKELYHIMGFSSSATNIDGDSPIDAIALEVKQQIQGRYHNLQLLNNGGRLSLIVTFKEPETPDAQEHAERKQRIHEDLGGGENAGGIAVISAEDMSIQEVGKSNKDMDYSQLDKIAGQTVYLRYNIPLPIVSIDASTYNNMESAVAHLYDWAVLPLVGSIFSNLSKFLLPRYNLDPSQIWLTYDKYQIDSLRTRSLEELKTRREINIETINELRDEMPNRPPVAGGDLLYQKVSEVPLGEVEPTEDDVDNFIQE